MTRRSWGHQDLGTLLGRFDENVIDGWAKRRGLAGRFGSTLSMWWTSDHDGLLNSARDDAAFHYPVRWLQSGSFPLCNADLGRAGNLLRTTHHMQFCCAPS